MLLDNGDEAAYDTHIRVLLLLRHPAACLRGPAISMDSANKSRDDGVLVVLRTSK